MALEGMITTPSTGGKSFKVADVVDIRICLANSETGGKLAIFEETIPPHHGVPFHIHKHEDEMFHFLEGEYQIWCGNKTYMAYPGDIVFLPKNVPHTFYNHSSSRGRTLNTYLPGGFDEFIEILSKLPGNTDLTTLGELGDKYGIHYSYYLPWKHEGPHDGSVERFYDKSELVKNVRFTNPEALKIFNLID